MPKQESVRKKEIGIILEEYGNYVARCEGDRKKRVFGKEIDGLTALKQILSLITKPELEEKEVEKFIDNFIMNGSYSDLRQTKPIAKAICSHFSKPSIVPSEQIELIKKLSTKAKEMLTIMEKHNIVIDNLDDKMQKFAFTLYSELVELSEEAKHLLEP